MRELTGIRYLAAIILWSILLGEVITITLAAMVITVGILSWANLPTVFIGSCFIGLPFAWGGCRKIVLERIQDDEFVRLGIAAELSFIADRLGTTIREQGYERSR